MEYNVFSSLQPCSNQVSSVCYRERQYTQAAWPNVNKESPRYPQGGATGSGEKLSLFPNLRNMIVLEQT